MTLYQAKGLEFPIVFVPSLLDGEWPTREGGGGFFPPELLREAVPAGDIHTDEERRLLYVAMTRAQERLILTTHGGPAATRGPRRCSSASCSTARARSSATIDRTATPTPGQGSRRAPTTTTLDDDATERDAERRRPRARRPRSIRRVMPLPTTRERRLALRLRASELVGLLEGDRRRRPGGRRRPRRGSRRSSRRSAGRPRWRPTRPAPPGLDPLTFRDVALDTGAGANLLQVAPLPPTFSYSPFDTYDALPAPVRVRLRLPDAAGREEPVAAFTFGSTAHAAFEAFTKERRERAARGEPPPTREDLERAFRARWVPTDFGDKTHRGGLPAARRDPARQLLDRRGQQPRRGAPRGAATSS